MKAALPLSILLFIASLIAFQHVLQPITSANPNQRARSAAVH